MEIDVTRPEKLYRYSEKHWLSRSLELGEFRLRPASDYKDQETDSARHDDELVRTTKSPASSVTITNVRTGQRIEPIGEVEFISEVGTNYLTVCFSKCWDEQLFNEFPDTDSCLVIHDVNEFCKRLHKAAEQILPEWVGIDAQVIYGGESGFGPVFSKPIHFFSQQEWRFAWNPSKPHKQIEPVIVTIGDISDIAEIVEIVDKPIHDLRNT